MKVIIRPIVTEKMTQKTESLYDYGFVVNKKVNKIEIKRAVETNYNVKVKSSFAKLIIKNSKVKLIRVNNEVELKNLQMFHHS